MANKTNSKVNDFNIQLKCDVDETYLQKKIDKSLSKMNFTIKVNVDTSEIDKATQLTNKGKNTKINNDFISKDLVSKIRANSDAIDSFVVSTDKAGNAIKVVTTEYNNLNEIITKTWGTGAKSIDDYTVQVQKNTTGVKQNLKLQEQNERTVYKLEKAIDSYSSQTKISKKETADFTQKLKDIQNQGLSPIEKSKALDKLNTDLKTAANSTGILGQSFSKAMVKYVTWLGIATIVAQITNAIKSMVSAVSELDASLVELNKVFDASKEEINQVKNTAFELADGLGTTATAVINATTEFKRMGYTIEQSLDLAEIAVMMTNVAEGITDTSNAANILVSILKGANLDVSQAASILDKLNEISNNNAVSFDNLATMLQEASATMTLLGNSVDQTMGLLVGGFEVLQNPKVAKGIQTIGLRIAGLNEDMETQAGLANDVSKALERYADISIWDEQTGALKNTYTILSEVAAKWDEIGESAGHQEALLNTLAGKERADVASAIIQNWEAVEKSIGDAANSVGSAAQEQEAYLNSIEGKQEAIANAWQKLADITINSDFIKFILDATKAILDLVNATGGLIPIVTALLGLLITFKGAAFIDMFKKLGEAIKGLGTAFKTATLGAQGLQAAMGWIGLIVAGVSLLVQGISGIVTIANNAAKAAEEARQEQIKSNEETIAKLEETKQRYKELSEVTNRTAEEENELLAIQKSLADNYGYLKDQIDGVNGSYEEYLGLTEEAIRQKKIEQLGLMQQDVENARNTIEKLQSGRNKTYGQDGSYYKETKKVLTTGRHGTKTYTVGPDDYSIESLEARKSQLESYLRTRMFTKEEQEEYTALTNYLRNYNEQLEATQKTIDDYNALWNDVYGNTQDNNEEIDEYTQHLEKLKNELTKINNEISDYIANNKEQNETLKMQQKVQEKLLAVEKARAELAEARNRRSRVYRAGRGLVYEEDFSAVQSAQENLDNAISDLKDSQTEVAEAFAQALREQLNSSTILEGWEKIFDDFGEVLDDKFADYLNKIKENINNFNNSVGEGENRINIGNNASGTMNWRGGPTWVGENGPEILNLPRGSEILSNSRSMKLHNIVSNPSAYVNGNSSFGGGKVVNINGPINLPNVSNAKGFIDELSKIGNGGIVSFA